MQRWTGVGAITLLLAASAWGQGLPPEQRVGEVSFVTGGASESELVAFRQASSRYPLAIEVRRTSSGRPGPTTGAQVAVMSRSGEEVISTRSDGPFVLARVPPGDYVVQAELNGRVLSQEVVVTGTGTARAVITFAGD
jgi:hypothetical protein